MNDKRAPSVPPRICLKYGVSPARFIRGLRVLDHFGIPIQHLFHVAIRLSALNLDGGRGKGPHDFVRELGQHARLVVETLGGEIAQQQLD